MKYKIKISLILAALSVVAGVTSCNDFLDVRPKSEIPAGLHFDRESGYFDQLTGVYTKMCSPEMYGKEMTFGLIEVLAQNYDLGANSPYRFASAYNYRETNTKTKIDDMWSNTYNCIANLNLMLEYIDTVEPAIFSDDNYRIYKGQALALRAYLHLDMLRIFAPSYASNPSASAIPYVTKYEPKITERSTVTQALDLIIADLTQASELLKGVGTIYSDDFNIVSNGKRYFNYFAVQTTLARAYLYKEDDVNAMKHAQIVIDESEKTPNSILSWTHFTAIETTYDYECNRLYTNEMPFQLNIAKMDDLVKKAFTSQAGVNTLSPNDAKADMIYEKTSKGYGNDYRMLKNFGFDGANKYLSKFWQYEQGTYNNIFPLIRKTEAFYIAAEVQKKTDPTKAIELLNVVRSHRNLTAYALPTTLNQTEIQQEIYKEYRKEFLGEGQLFFYYKRLNLPNIDGAAIVATDNVYVLPKPDNEVEFGSRK